MRDNGLIWFDHIMKKGDLTPRVVLLLLSVEWITEEIMNRNNRKWHENS